MKTQTYYAPQPLGVNATYDAAAAASCVGSFLAITAGTVTITKRDGTVVVAAYPVAAGSNTPFHYHLGHGFVVVLAGGASGTLGVGN